MYKRMQSYCEALMSELELSNNRCVVLKSKKRGFKVDFDLYDGRKGGFNSS